MADILKTITLTSLGSNAGPLFDIYYSTDCISYTQSVDGNDVSLPEVGSSVNVTMPDNTSCVKLVNLSQVCGLNNVVQYLSIPTTTITPTAVPTTLVPTTLVPTTTAVPCPECVSYQRRLQTAGSGTAVWSYTDCIDGSTKTVSISSTVERTFGSRTAPVYVSGPATIGTAQETLPAGTGCGPFDYCNYETWRIVTKNTSPPGFIYYSYLSTGSCVVASDFFQIDATTDVTVVKNSLTLGASTSDFTSITLIGSGSFAGCCPTTTIAPTTLVPTTLVPTTTTIAPTKYRYLRYDINESTCLTTGSPIPLWSYTSYTSGFYYIESDPTKYYLQVSSHSDDTFQFTSVTPFTCTPPTTTLTPTVTPTVTPTATPTLAPGYFRALSCANLSTQVYSTLLAAGTFNSGDRVLVGGLPYVIDGFTTSLPEATYTFTATGETGCPATTLTPTETPTTLVPTTTSTTTATPTITPTVTPTATPTVTPTITPTASPVYYQILSCADSSVAWSVQYPSGTYNSGDRVITNTFVTAIVIGSSTTNFGGTLTLTSTGETGCPTTTLTPTATPTTLTPTTTSTTTATPTVTPTITPTAAPTTTTAGATLSWSFNEQGGANGTMDIYVNGSIVESRSSNSSGTYPVNVGDTIFCEINATGCSGFLDIANAYCTGIITEAACDPGVTFLTSNTYTVVSGDVGNILTLAMIASCDTACV